MWPEKMQARWIDRSGAVDAAAIRVAKDVWEDGKKAGTLNPNALKEVNADTLSYEVDYVLGIFEQGYVGKYLSNPDGISIRAYDDFRREVERKVRRDWPYAVMSFEKAAAQQEADYEALQKRLGRRS